MPGTVDLALASAGGKVILATCYDERFPPESVIDGSKDTFWATTGLFPQEIVVALPKVSDIQRITTTTMHVRKMVVETCSSERPVTFERVFEADPSNTKGQLQTETHEVGMEAKFVKLIIESGYQTFAGLGKLSIIGEGEADEGGYSSEEVEQDGF